ncbi:prostaglandin reductase-3-like [Clytia hemisphaerica]|uniref:15-oxoprostaglandin 13-reductase n=1 Tax=Clytia hemisphaerica TaxID=252671 RepID=A0A7M5UXZ8_9CNID|eukprot:TCONS_00072205-protein
MTSFRKLVASTLTTDFRIACEIVRSNVGSLKPHEVLVKARYAGINATDINYTAGRYTKPGTPLPLDAGLEGVGEIVDVGQEVPSSMIGKPVGYLWNGAFAEYVKLPAKFCLPLPSVKPEYVGLLVSGMTASMCLQQSGRIQKGEAVFISAAAGGFGHLAVQLAKLHGCHVIGTCSSQQKTEYLKSLGCDHVINYVTEDLNEVLKKSYPKGIDVFIESVGGDVFNACVNRLATNGRLVVLGYIGSYHSQAGIDRSHRNATLMTKLLLKSATVSGFFLLNHPQEYKNHLPRLVELADQGKLQVKIDQTDDQGKPFVGLESVYDAVDYLYSRKSQGKVVVDLTNSNSKL